MWIHPDSTSIEGLGLFDAGGFVFGTPNQLGDEVAGEECHRGHEEELCAGQPEGYHPRPLRSRHVPVARSRWMRYYPQVETGQALRDSAHPQVGRISPLRGRSLLVRSLRSVLRWGCR